MEKYQKLELNEVENISSSDRDDGGELYFPANNSFDAGNFSECALYANW